MVTTCVSLSWSLTPCYNKRMTTPELPDLLHRYHAICESGHLKVPFMDAGESPVFSPFEPPQLGQLPSRFQATLLGVAIGDAFSISLERQAPGTGQPIQTYQELFPGGPSGVFSDDTQFTVCLAESLIANKALVPEDLQRRFADGPMLSEGKTIQTFVARTQEGLRWFETGTDSAGNGVAMRSAPLGLWYRHHFPSLKLAAGLQAMITHNNSMAIASAIVAAYGVALLLRTTPQEFQDLDTRIAFCRQLGSTIRGLESDQIYRTSDTHEPDTLFNRLYYRVPELLIENRIPQHVAQVFGTSAYTLESMPFALYCFLYYAQDFHQTLLHAAHCSEDRDTVAAMACSFSGALNGIEGIPDNYLQDLQDRYQLPTLGLRLLGTTEIPYPHH